MKHHLENRKRAGVSRKARRFLPAEDGAITVDWVVLTGMIVLLGIAAGFAVTANIPGLADDVGDYLDEQEIREG